MAQFGFRFPRAFKPKLVWWSNEWDIKSLVVVILLTSFFLPILPWEGRKKGNYSLTENISTLYKAGSREHLDFESIEARYEKEIPDKDFRECVVARNIILTMVSESNIALQDVSMVMTRTSNVPFVFLFDSIINNMLNSLAIPDFSTVFIEVAKKCQNYPNAYLTVKDVQNLGRKEMR